MIVLGNLAHIGMWGAEGDRHFQHKNDSNSRREQRAMYA